MYKNNKVTSVPEEYQKIRVHLVFGVKHDGRHKARHVADGHPFESVENVYSGVVSLRSLRVVVFLAVLNKLEVWGVDICNTYLEAYTDEKLSIVAGPEFKKQKGDVLVIRCELYGTKIGGARWHDRFFH